MMNMAWAVRDGLGNILRGLLFFSPDVYRPTGALYYLALHTLFGLDPLPFRVFDLLTLAINLALAGRLAYLLSGSLGFASLCTFLFAYHERITLIVAYSGAFVYDRLCGTFALVALCLYATARQAGTLSPRSVVGILAAYWLALGAKEVAVTVPVLFFGLELCVFRHKAARSAYWSIGGLAVIAAIYAGRKINAGVYASNPEYAMQFTLQRFLDSQARHLADYLFLDEVSHVAVAWAAGLLTLVGILLRSGLFGFGVWFGLTVALPFVFVDRGGACLYLPWLGWSMALSEAAIRTARASASGLRRDWLRPYLTAAAQALVGILLFLRNAEFWEPEHQAFYRNSDRTWNAIQSLQGLGPALRPGARVFFRDNPFEGWDLHFILTLATKARPLQIYIAGKNAVAPPAGAVVLSVSPEGIARVSD
jgi:hypothetical protein